LAKFAFEEGERKWKKRKVEYLDKFPVSGKILKTPEKSKN